MRVFFKRALEIEEARLERNATRVYILLQILAECVEEDGRRRVGGNLLVAVMVRPMFGRVFFLDSRRCMMWHCRQ